MARGKGWDTPHRGPRRRPALPPMDIRDGTDGGVWRDAYDRAQGSIAYRAGEERDSSRSAAWLGAYDADATDPDANREREETILALAREQEVGDLDAVSEGNGEGEA